MVGSGYRLYIRFGKRKIYVTVNDSKIYVKVFLLSLGEKHHEFKILSLLHWQILGERLNLTLFPPRIGQADRQR